MTTPDGTTTVASTAYGYDRDDNLTSKQTTGTAGAGQQSYGYDQAGRLTSWTKDGTTTSYEWDAAGNRTRAGSTTSTFDARNRQLTAGAQTFTYTARGTLSSVDAGTGALRNLTFDAFERKVTDGATAYRYDSMDRVQTRGSTTLTYDGGSNNLASDGTTTYNRTPEGSLLSYEVGASGQLALTDRHTDLVAGLNTDATGVIGSTSYDPFGTETATNGTTPEIGYQSGWTDPTNGDVNMAARWYQPGTGAFASRDTWLLDPTSSVQANRHVYGSASPLIHIDPLGHDVIAPGRTRVPYSSGSGSLYSSGGWSQLRSLSRWAGGMFMRNNLLGRALSLISLFSSESTTTGHFGTVYPSGTGAGGGGSPASQPAGSSSLVCTGSCGGGSKVPTSSAGAGGGGGGGGGGGTGCAPNCVVTPPKPPIDQNPNNGPNPIPAPTLPPGQVDWTSAVWGAGQGVSETYTSQAILDMLAVAIFTPNVVDGLEIFPFAEPSHLPGGGSRGRSRSDNKCDDGPGTSATGHVTYLPRERYYDNFSKQEECRAIGIYGFIDKSDLTTKAHPGPGTSTGSSKKPPGYEEIRSQGYMPNNGHLQPKLGGGDGKDLRNRVPQYHDVNSPYIRDGVEADIRASLEAGHTVSLSITPRYGNVNSGIPGLIEYNYTDLSTGVAKHCVVHNQGSGGRTAGSSNCPNVP
ncbi:hypothetical protein OG595_10230 [Streptomyces sp. NBC_01451]|nr:RHS repeat-associated core domain-containing protein [Streptomyces sp. NBC_01451]